MEGMKGRLLSWLITCHLPESILCEVPNLQGDIFIYYIKLATQFFYSHFKDGETESEIQKVAQFIYLMSSKADIKIHTFSTMPYCPIQGEISKQES
jgi:hypothetical protein